MFERFTDSARRAVVTAQEGARRLNHEYIGTEHVLLGLLGEGRGLAATVLTGLGLTLDDVRTSVEEIVGLGVSTSGAHIPFTPRAKKVLELSLRESLQLHHNYIGTEHILLGLVREGEGVAVQVLVLHEVDLQQVRERLIEGAESRRGRRLGNPAEDTVLFTPAQGLGARLERIQESLDRIERRLDAMGVPPAPDDTGTDAGTSPSPSPNPNPGPSPSPSPGTGEAPSKAPETPETPG